MGKNNLQTTVKQLEEFLSAYYRKTGVRPTLGEALDMMEKTISFPLRVLLPRPIPRSSIPWKRSVRSLILSR